MSDDEHSEFGGVAPPECDEDRLIPISALQHYVFCPRQCALIHVESQWADNHLTVEGTDMHERVDETGRRQETRGDMRIVRRLDLRCDRLGLVGRADVVEFIRVPAGQGAILPGIAGRWQPLPVEYKRGRPKRHDADRVQLCAQAVCLEEMLAVHVPRGALYYGQPRRRTDVEFDAALRSLTEDTCRAVHELVAGGIVPQADLMPKCRSCSLEKICLPSVTSGKRSARDYLTDAVRDLESSSRTS